MRRDIFYFEITSGCKILSVGGDWLGQSRFNFEYRRGKSYEAGGIPTRRTVWRRSLPSVLARYLGRMPTASAEDLCRSEGTERRVSPETFPTLPSDSI